MKIAHIGSASCISSTSCTSFSLHDLLHVPNITKNLLSVSKFARDNNVFFEFHPHSCYVKHQVTKQILLQGTLKDDLYIFPDLRSTVFSANYTSFKSAKPPLHLWHNRLGHCSFSVIKTILKHCDISCNAKPIFCDACVKGKAHQLPFSLSTTVYHHPLELIYIDIWGPSAVCANNGASYYISFLDAYSKYTWIYLLHTKSQALAAFERFKLFSENQTGFKIKTIQTDNAKEFVVFNTFLLKHGIQHRFICPHTHEQNGAIERKHRHITDMGLSMLAAASLPVKFWVEAFITATHIINVLPSIVLKGQTPYELLLKTKPDYTKFRSFGCACYPLMRPYNKHKLDFRSACCLFLGYSLHNKGYICLSSSGKTFISRHVVFNEDVFPYSNPQYGFLPALSTPSISPPIHPTLTVLSSPTHSTVAPSASLPTSSLHLQQSSSCSTAPITRNSSPTHNIHPMKTRAKAGIVKPKIFSAHIDSGSPEPTTVAAAFASPQWTQAMNDEYRALITNGTWTLTSLPPGANLVGCKWIFKHKFNADGSFQRHKARLEAKGYSQSEGLDYSATFSPVVKPTTIRVVLAHAVSSHWPIHQIDINNAFLNGDLHEHVYMQQPPGFLATNPKLVCKLHKAIYGLKQAPRAWFQKLSHTLNNIGFRSTISDPSLFVRFTNSSTLFVLIYVDDIIITGSSSTAITSLITTLSSHFALKDLGPLHHFLGIEVSTLPSGHLHLSQRRYIQNLLHRTNMLDSNPQPTPMISSLKLPKDATAAVPDPSMFRSVVGALQYALFTRLNSLIQSTKFRSSCIALRNIIGKLSNGFSDISKARCIMVSSSNVAPTPISWGFVIQTGEMILMIENPPLVTVSILVPILSHGHLTNKRLFLEAVQRLNIVG